MTGCTLNTCHKARTRSGGEHFEHMLQIYLHRQMNKQLTFLWTFIEIKRYCTILSLITFRQSCTVAHSSFAR